MLREFYGLLPGLILGIVFLSALICMLVKEVKNRYAPVKTVKARVIRKHKVDVVSKYAGKGKQEHYVVVFSAEGKTLSFYVSAFSYNGYKVKETGILKYKGSRIISFR